jgi:YD repeat-containing protein
VEIHQIAEFSGNSTSYTSALIGGIWLPTNSQGSGCSSCSLRGTIQSTYDNAGNVLTRTDELGRTTTYGYDNNGNATAAALSASATIRLADESRKFHRARPAFTPMTATTRLRRRTPQARLWLAIRRGSTSMSHWRCCAERRRFCLINLDDHCHTNGNAVASSDGGPGKMKWSFRCTTRKSTICFQASRRGSATG